MPQCVGELGQNVELSKNSLLFCVLHIQSKGNVGSAAWPHMPLKTQGSYEIAKTCAWGKGVYVGPCCTLPTILIFPAPAPTCSHAWFSLTVNSFDWTAELPVSKESTFHSPLSCSPVSSHIENSVSLCHSLPPYPSQCQAFFSWASAVNLLRGPRNRRMLRPWLPEQ